MLAHARPRRKLLPIFAAALALACAAPMAAAQSVPMLLQAEAMTLVAPMASGYDIAAMGGRFISATSGTSTTFPSRNASVEVSIPTAGTYYLWARIAGATDTSDALYVGIDSSFDRVFPSALGAYQWVRVETSDGSGAHGFALTAGTHTLQVGYGEIGAKLDALYLTANASEVPALSAPARLLIEAEALNRVSPMTVGSEPAALGGQYLSPTSGTTTTSPVRSAHVQVQVPAGTFYLWARIAGPTMTSDALYLGINSSFDRVFPSAQGPYQWVRVETTDGSGAHGFVLAAGAHTIQVGYGEIGSKLDAVYLTNDAAEVPAFAPMRRVIEAESFTLQPPMTLGVDAAASGAQYISATSGTTSTSPVREAFTSVTAPVSGTYYLWARLWGATDTSDALYLGFDSAFARAFPTALGAYEWVRVESAPGNFGFSLTAGAHDIQVGHGEIGARLDAVYVTDDANDSPTGSTPPPPPSSGFPGPCAVPTGGYEGFGRNTTGGQGQAIYRVTNRNNTGAGSLRDALSQGNRCVVFDVGGTINLAGQVTVRSNVTIDGFTAPSPGITLLNTTTADQPAVTIHGNHGTGNVVIRGIRIRKATDDGITITTHSGNGQLRNIVIDRVSVSGSGDGAIDVTGNVQDVTIQWSILGPGDPQFAPFFPMLIATAPDGAGTTRISRRITAHHNLYFGGEFRHPRCSASGGTPAMEVMCDVRNNLMWDYSGDGTQVDFSATANIVSNYYHWTGRRDHNGNTPSDASTIRLSNGASAYVNSNHSQNGFNLNDNGNRSTPVPVNAADVPAFTDAVTAARDVRAGAGARGPSFGLDATDQGIINSISIP